MVAVTLRVTGSQHAERAGYSAGEVGLQLANWSGVVEFEVRGAPRPDDRDEDAHDTNLIRGRPDVPARATGGRTPKASAVRKMMFSGWVPTPDRSTCGM